MPRNVTGGSGHKSQRNSEGSKARANRELVNDLLDDYKSGAKTDGVHVGRILRRMGNGRMEVMYFVTRPADENERERIEMVQQVVPMRGGLRGKGKGTVWVDIGSMSGNRRKPVNTVASIFLASMWACALSRMPDRLPRMLTKRGTLAWYMEMVMKVLELSKTRAG